MSEQYLSKRSCVELSVHRNTILSICKACIIWSLAQGEGAIYIGILIENASIHCLSASGPICACQRGRVCIVHTNASLSSVAIRIRLM